MIGMPMSCLLYFHDLGMSVKGLSDMKGKSLVVTPYADVATESLSAPMIDCDSSGDCFVPALDLPLASTQFYDIAACCGSYGVALCTDGSLYCWPCARTS